jgi:hydrogenase maturation protein HypF
VTPVQHHHAHIAAVLAEHGHDGNAPVIGVAFDGTGYGDDAAIWGGEILLADYKQYRRVGQLAYVPLAGGDISVQRPYRMALAHLRASGVPWTTDLPCVDACPPQERRVLAHQLESGLGCVPTSSMGRLFDAVASLAGVRHAVDYEAQAAIELEGVARAAEADGSYRFDVADDGEHLVFDAAPLIRSAAADVLAGLGAAVVAARFHEAVAAVIADVVTRVARRTGVSTVALGGGVFQNVVLLRVARRRLVDAGLEVLVPSQLPPNDGGLALGQIMIAAQ